MNTQANIISAKQAWINFLTAIDTMNDDETRTWFNSKQDDEVAIKLVEAVQAKVPVLIFDEKTCIHWCIEIFGSFEVTHRDYKSPEHMDSTEVHRLMNHIMKMTGFPEDCLIEIDD